jgi:DNA-binding response OmpR family regulator
MHSLHSTRKRIVVVDDDRAILDLVSTRLTLAGYDVFSARDGQEAAMVLDLNMPGLDGFGVLQRLGKAGTARLPILVLTARHDVADVQRAIGLGARDYLAKPFKDAQLLMRVARLVRPPVDRRSTDDVITGLDNLITVAAREDESRPTLELFD